jgi:carboxyl-terminal processing protease
MQPDDPNAPDAPTTNPDDPAPAPPADVDGGEVGAGVGVGPDPDAASRSGGRLRGPLSTIALALVAVIGGGALFLSGYTLGQRQAGQPGTAAADAEAFKPFWTTYHYIVDKYPLGSVDRQTLVDGAIRGMVESLGDPYSSYLGPGDFEQTLQDISGQFEGIGAEIGTVDANGKTVDCGTFSSDCFLAVVSPLDGSPAQKAGLKPGDVILMVDGSSLEGLTPDQARDHIRGKKGTSVVLRIKRAGVADFDVTIVRDTIQRREVVAKELADGTVGYVRLAGFSEGGADQFVAAVKADVDKGITRFVIDLRGNPGGFIDAARKVASTFIASGPVFWEEDAQGNQTATDATGDGVATDPAIRVILLIDKGSASASEIVAGALQDTGRATLVGETSFGKGTVQQWLTLEGAGGVKLTTFKWLTPDKRWIHKVGITPDVPVTVPADTPVGQDPVLDKALELLGASALAPGLLHAA